MDCSDLDMSSINALSLSVHNVVVVVVVFYFFYRHRFHYSEVASWNKCICHMGIALHDDGKLIVSVFFAILSLHCRCWWTRYGKFCRVKMGFPMLSYKLF